MTATGVPLEIWGGIECSVNRVGDRYHNQLDLGGHARRSDDIDRIASLGIRTLRYPFLWELVAPDAGTFADWGGCEARLQRMRGLGIQPIAGFVHHGSGPPHTSLLHAGFAHGLAEYAGDFARRFPWVEQFTPVNEPLTTARFSALYGLWYPHSKSGQAFARALVNQCRATILAMRAIERVNPGAKLVQTEDLGRVYSTPTLAYQARFENHRRWLSWDLLCGKVDRAHPMWERLLGWGIQQYELEWFRTNPRPPDVIGINHYVTSNRYLDERAEQYPARYRGGNGKHTYADVEAVRVLPDTVTSWADLIEEAWQRYGLPVAITEVHLGCTREEQMRWLFQAWNAAKTARSRGCDVRAITPWALFGSHDWASLLTRFEGEYESGAWDVRSRPPRRTALAGLIGDLTAGREPDADSWVRLPGWWQRDSRLLASANNGRAVVACQTRNSTGIAPAPPRYSAANVAPVLITGGTGTLGRAFARACELRGLPYRLLTRQDMDIVDPEAVRVVLDSCAPMAVINTAGYVRVDDAEGDRERCERENVLGPTVLAQACATRQIPFVTFSSDLVFDGQATRPYVEFDEPAPLNVYGDTKARAESGVLALHPRAIVIRTSAFFGPWDEHNFVTLALRTLARGEVFLAADDIAISPTYVPDLTHAALDLLLDGESGIWHLANQGSVSWFELARAAAIQAGVPIDHLFSAASRDLGWRAERPAYSVLGSSRALLLPTLESALARYCLEADIPGASTLAEDDPDAARAA